MCKNNYIKYIKSGNLVSYKKYLYAYRGLINAKWVLYKKTIPPIIFSDALKEIKEFIPDSVFKKIYEIIEVKSKGKEKDIIENISFLDKYIEDFIKKNDQIDNDNDFIGLDDLNNELRKIILN